MNELLVLSHIYKKEVVSIKPDWEGMVYVYFSNGEFEHTEWRDIFCLVCDSIKELSSTRDVTL